MNNPRPPTETIFYLSCKVTHYHSTSLSLENEGITPFPYVPQAMEQKNLKMMNTGGSEFVLQTL